MISGRFYRFAAVIVVAFAMAFPAHAQTESEVRVATRVLPPLVIDQHGILSGFSIDIWNAIAERSHLRTSFLVAPDVTGLLDEVRSGKARVGIAAVSITAAREAEFDFSQPIMNAGLQIMVRGKGHNATFDPLRDLLSLLFSQAILVWFGIALLLILVPAHLMWLSERRHHSGIIPSARYFPGIFHALFWAAGTLATQADQMPRHWLARLIAVMWMFTAVVFVAFYTAQLTASLTVQKIQESINGPDDLQGRKIATTTGSTAAAFLEQNRAQVMQVESIDEAYRALLDREVDAIVFDGPVLLSYAANEGKRRVHLVGGMFRKEDYGIVFAQGDPMRKQVNNALLTMREDGTYQQIYEKWFGYLNR